MDSLFFKEYSLKISDFFLNRIDQLGTVQPMHRASLCGTLTFVIFVPKSYMDWAHKPQISPRHGLDPVLEHVMGFLQPTDEYTIGQ